MKGHSCHLHLNFWSFHSLFSGIEIHKENPLKSLLKYFMGTNYKFNICYILDKYFSLPHNNEMTVQAFTQTKILDAPVKAEATRNICFQQKGESL